MSRPRILPGPLSRRRASDLAPVAALLALAPGPGAPQGASPEPPGETREAGEARAAEETARQRDLFPAFVWRGGDAPESEAEAALLAPFGGAPLIGADEGRWLREHDLDFFVFNAAGRDELHLDRERPDYRQRWRAWYDGRDDVHLIRQPCLTNPATRALLRRRLEDSLEARGGDWGRGVSLGDEVSLTPAGSPEDVCLSPTCRRAWTAFLAGRPELDEADRDRLADPARWSTDRARLALSEGDTGPLQGWLLRREFHQQIVLGLLEELARQSRALEPRAPVGLLGLGGQTAFGNVAVERALPFLDFIECYPVGNARELAFTLRDQHLDTWATVFVEPDIPNFASHQTWMHWLRGGDGLVVWSERELVADPEQAERLAEAVATIRALRERFGDFEPTPRGVALVHSPRSVAVSWLRDALLDGPTWPRRLAGMHEREGTLERSRSAWLRFLEDQGLMPGALPLDHVGERTVRRFPTLILSHTLLVDDEERARLEAYLDAGGTLVVQGQFGWLDGRARPRERPLLMDLLEAYPRVLVAPDLIDEYPEVRGAENAARREVLERRLWAYLPAIRPQLDRAPFRLRGGFEGMPWLMTWMRHRQTGGWLCAAIPTPTVERPVTGGFEVRVEPLEALEVEWVHPRRERSSGAGPEAPPDRARTQAGDAIVFLLVPPRGREPDGK